MVYLGYAELYEIGLIVQCFSKLHLQVVWISVCMDTLVSSQTVTTSFRSTSSLFQ